MAEKNNVQENRENISKKASLQIFYSNSEKMKNELKKSKINTKPMSPSEILHLHGNIEMEEGEEIDLHKHLTHCKKNPKHQQFIPFKDLTMEHLPEGYHDTDLFKLIKVTGDLTVRISVKKVSPHRPQFWPDTNVPYPFYNQTENVNMRSGSGEIYVYKLIDGERYGGNGKRISGVTGENIECGYKTCPCDKCVDSGKPSNIWWEIRVHTATHVVFDDIEARYTSCRLFFDSEDSEVLKLDEFSLVASYLKKDQCSMKIDTCEEFGELLYDMEVQCYDLLRKVWGKYLNRSDVIFIVSHPHGCFKQVSIGYLLDNLQLGKYDERYDITKLTYTTGTCPGSSGAKVYCVGSVSDHVHAGGLNSECNYSSVSIFRRFDVQ